MIFLARLNEQDATPSITTQCACFLLFRTSVVYRYLKSSCVHNFERIQSLAVPLLNQSKLPHSTDTAAGWVILLTTQIYEARKDGVARIAQCYTKMTASGGMDG